MSNYLKLTASVLLLFLIQLYGLLVVNYNFPSVLNEAWYIGSFWLSGALGIFGLFLSLVLISTTDSQDDKESTIKMFGFDELNTWIYCKPFFIMSIIFVQMGSLWSAAFCFGVWSYQALQVDQHKCYLREHLAKEAEKGTNK